MSYDHYKDHPDLDELYDRYPNILDDLMDALYSDNYNFDSESGDGLTTNFDLSFTKDGYSSVAEATIDNRYEGSIKHPTTGEIWYFTIREGNSVGTEVEHFEKDPDYANKQVTGWDEISDIPKAYLESLSNMPPEERAKELYGSWDVEAILRRTGRTTQLLQNAPKGAIFIWCNEDISYVRQLTADLDRFDIVLRGPRWIYQDRWRGLDDFDVVFDHDFNPKTFWEAAKVTDLLNRLEHIKARKKREEEDMSRVDIQENSHMYDAARFNAEFINYCNNDVTLSEELLKQTSPEEETQMTQRRTVTIELIDDDTSLPVENALVASFPDIITEDDNDTTIQQLLMDKDIAGKLKEHNEVRGETVNKTVLESTGREVSLLPVKLKDLRFVVK